MQETGCSSRSKGVLVIGRKGKAGRKDKHVVFIESFKKTRPGNSGRKKIGSNQSTFYLLCTAAANPKAWLF